MLPHFDIIPSNPFRLGKSLEKNLRRSLAWSKSQRAVAALMSGSYDVATVKKWRKMREKYDLNPSKPNPYEEDDNCAYSVEYVHAPPDQFPDATMAELKVELLEEEAKELLERAPLHKVSAGTFFCKAIDIEDRW